MSFGSISLSSFNRRYTMVQCVLGLIGILMPIVNMLFPIRIFDGSLLMPTLASKTLVTGVGLTIGSSAYARFQEHPLASALTIWSTIIGAIVLYPLGTVAFIYWFGWVRKRERAGKKTIDHSHG